jgi:hypothetical protein
MSCPGPTDTPAQPADADTFRPGDPEAIGSPNRTGAPADDPDPVADPAAGPPTGYEPL